MNVQCWIIAIALFSSGASMAADQEFKRYNTGVGDRGASIRWSCNGVATNRSFELNRCHPSYVSNDSAAVKQGAANTPFYSESGGTVLLNIESPVSLLIPCGHGSIKISLDTGKVTLTNCDLDDGAKAFWDAVERFAPRSRQ